MNLILNIYLTGVIFNLLVFAYQYYKGRNTIQIDLKGAIIFILASWVVYLVILARSRRY